MQAVALIEADFGLPRRQGSAAPSVPRAAAASP
jgi:hypothetical protein